MASIVMFSLCSCDYFDTMDEIRNGKAQEDYHTRPSDTESSATTEETEETVVETTMTMPGSGYIRYIGGQANKFMYYNAPAVGEVKFPIFMVDFPGTSFSGNRMSINELKNLVFDEDTYYSMANRINKSSYGLLSIDGGVYSYTAANPIEYYISDERDYEKLALEVLDAFEEELDFTEFDSDGNGVLDFFVFNIAGNNPYFRGCTSNWWRNPDYRIDGEVPGYYVILDAQPFDVSGYQEYYIQELMHEMGHCLGLPDYYIRGENYDEEGFVGDAGNEMMDEMKGDYSMFSKIMLGWATDDGVNVYSDRGGEEQPFILYPTDKVSSCVVLPKSTSVVDVFLSEYFLIEYYSGEGVRVFHIDSSTHTNSYATSFEYSNLYPDGEIRLIDLVNNGDGYMEVGDVIDFSSEGFAWYGDDKTASVDSGYSIRLDGITEDSAVITIIKNN